MPDNHIDQSHTEQVRTYLLNLQDTICTALADVDGRSRLPGRQLGSRGQVVAGALVSWRVARYSKRRASTSRMSSAPLCHRRQPPPAPNWPDAPFRPWASRWSSIRAIPMCRPRMPMCVSSSPKSEGAAPVWWFGGGFDLTPYYGFDEDAGRTGTGWQRKPVRRSVTMSIRATSSGVTSTSISSTAASRAVSAACSSTTSIRVASNIAVR